MSARNPGRAGVGRLDRHGDSAVTRHSASGFPSLAQAHCRAARATRLATRRPGRARREVHDRRPRTFPAAAAAASRGPPPQAFTVGRPGGPGGPTLAARGRQGRHGDRPGLAPCHGASAWYRDWLLRGPLSDRVTLSRPVTRRPGPESLPGHGHRVALRRRPRRGGLRRRVGLVPAAAPARLSPAQLRAPGPSDSDRATVPVTQPEWPGPCSPHQQIELRLYAIMFFSIDYTRLCTIIADYMRLFYYKNSNDYTRLFHYLTKDDVLCLCSPISWMMMRGVTIPA
jgi:hypothetical protein